ncbi:copper homeostasis protein CutC [Streptomyces sp. YIM 98790]|uniref:copper homeostasis protein CutC n=1 Tax=Streptomyces sp. YIM 98790 TaxID=2689077 RepID=UPI0014094E62|nr:copper homeostasis protein CutC [Streptomyces sp. YIM 98790]
MSRPLLEVIALDAEDAIAAQSGGADRLELVTEIAADGLTPAVETVAAIRDAVALPLRVMLRPGDGFRTGGPAALDGLCATAEKLCAEGAREFVLGFLDADGHADLGAIRTLTGVLGEEARWTCHRAIDHSADRSALRARLDGFPGLDTYLTAGSAAGVDHGMAVLRGEAARTAAGEPGYLPRLMVGGGLRLEHVPELLAAGVDAFHIGGAARPRGWSGPVTATAVAAWRTALDDGAAATA